LLTCAADFFAALGGMVCVATDGGSVGGEGRAGGGGSAAVSGGGGGGGAVAVVAANAASARSNSDGVCAVSCGVAVGTVWSCEARRLVGLTMMRGIGSSLSLDDDASVRRWTVRG